MSIGTNANSQENTHGLATPDRGAWYEIPLPINLWQAVNGGNGSAITVLTDVGATSVSSMNIGDAVDGVAANGDAGATFLRCSTVIPQLVVGAPSVLQALNAAAGGFGPFVELLICARARAAGGNEALGVTCTFLNGYGANAVWTSLDNKQSMTGTVGTNGALNVNATLSQSWRWVPVPLLRSDVPATTPPLTAANRDLLTATLRANNFPLPITFRIDNGGVALATNEFIDICGVVLRYRGHDASRNSRRLDFSDNPLKIATSISNPGSLALAPTTI